MSIGVQVWSTTASANSTADTNINWAEGMAPSQVNDSARAEMASVAKWRDDNNGTIVTGGTTLAYTATTNQVEAALTSGYTVAVQFHATNDAAATLAVDGLTAKPLQVTAGTNVAGGEFTIGNAYRFTYSTTGTGQWIALSYVPITTSLIPDNAVTYNKIQIPGASKLLGNPSTSTTTGYREISLGTNLTFSGQTLNAGNNTPVITVVTSTATVTWQSTTQNGNFPLYLMVRMVGGGGGGSASNTNAGHDGGDTSFDSWTAIHGSGGLVSAASGGAGGTGGAAGAGTLIRRISGSPGNGSQTSINVGTGGGSSIGPATLQPNANNSAGTNASANSGAGGSSPGGVGGVSGGGGAEYVEFMITSPSTAYTIQVGAGGAGGAAGGQPGGNGGAGRIEVISHWQ